MSKKLNMEPIDPKVAKAMVVAYAKDGMTSTESYTKAVWFPAEQILAIAKSMSEGKYDGLRIYFAQYLEGAIEGVPKSYEGRNTLLLVPTTPCVGSGNDEEEHKDDLDNIENRGTACPDMCEGTSL
ncbi:hypothetical protein [Pedobacter roseus]|jgi:hypothetical protein|uniref:Uncharacterized protein n=1 Tax=Pedobacter roseus TaxID=336820 RepID=A0A7G9QFL6_9SPHI|nr:hypothetical protein [Pedobacter roseus]QNN42141.1 hypothetical protein H9L23_24130 [Pedobacter roseus]